MSCIACQRKITLDVVLTDRAKLDDRLPEVVKFAEWLKDKYKFKTISILGYCWGERAGVPSY